MIPALCSVQPALIPATNTMFNTLQSLGMTSGLQTCLDASDANSYSGSGQTWTDETGNGYSFFRGTTGSGEASDPTFNGTAGSQTSSTYWSYAGAQWFTLNQANPAWVQQMHKAGAKFTLAGWYYVNGITSTAQNFFEFGDLDASVLNGIGGGASSAAVRAIGFEIDNASTVIYTKRSIAIANNNAWNFLAISADFSTGVVNFQVNGNSEAYTSQSFSGTPITGNAGNTFQLAAIGGASFPDSSGCRLANMSMWNIGLTSAQLASIFTATRAKFGV